MALGKAVPNTGHNMNAGIQEAFGGQGLYGSMSSYLKILKSQLVDDEVLLNKQHIRHDVRAPIDCRKSASIADCVSRRASCWTL